jgi:hypothetical protein
LKGVTGSNPRIDNASFLYLGYLYLFNNTSPNLRFIFELTYIILHDQSSLV